MATASASPVSAASLSAATRQQDWLATSGVKLACALWAVFAGTIIATQPEYVFSVYRDGALRWLAGEPLYNASGHGFIYLPQLAVLMLPWAWLPADLAQAVGRSTNVLVFAWGTWKLARLAAPERDGRLFLAATLVTLPLADACIRAGQMTLTMSGLMMLSTAALAERRWNRAAVCLTLAVALKPHAVVLWLLSAALVKEMRRPLLAGVAAAAIVPFLSQRWDYVAAQYAEMTSGIGSAVGLGLVADDFAHLYTLLETVGLPLESRGQLLTSAAAAVATLALAWRVLKTYPREQAGVLLFTLAAGYLLVFNPRSERNTYAMIAPAMGVLAAQWLLVEGRMWPAAATGLLAMLSVASHSLAKLTVGHSLAWPKPAICIAFLALAAAACARSGERRRSAPESAGLSDRDGSAKRAVS